MSYQSLTFNLETNINTYLSSSISGSVYGFFPAINDESIAVPYVVSKVVSLTERDDMPFSGVFDCSFQTAIVTNAANSGSMVQHDSMIESVRALMSDTETLRSNVNTTSSGCTIITAIPQGMMNRKMETNQWVYVADYQIITMAVYDPSLVVYDSH